MIVCSCNVISDTKIRDTLKSGACPRTPGGVYKCLGCSPTCGRCMTTLKTIIKEALANTAPPPSSCHSRRQKETETCPLS
ncbi:(2Fe-2S)-binding protein [Beijerinckiaceae bacterium]|nr:(2Fe-2S)-binding protein [Beijerinckiaceae bacterium]